MCIRDRPLIASIWFPADEFATATAIGLLGQPVRALEFYFFNSLIKDAVFSMTFTLTRNHGYRKNGKRILNKKLFLLECRVLHSKNQGVQNPLLPLLDTVKKCPNVQK